MSSKVSVRLLAAWFLSVTIPTCMADIVTSVSGSISLNGQAQCIDIFSFSCTTQSFSFAPQTSTQPSFSLSQSGGPILVTDPATGNRAGASGSVENDASLGIGELTTFLQAQDSVFNGFVDVSASVNASSSTTVTFDSSTSFRLDLSGSVEFLPLNPEPGDGLRVVLTGPGGTALLAVFANSSSSFPVSFDSVLGPGSYVLTETISFDDLQAGFGGETTNIGSIALNAEFASVPEPRWLAATVFAILCALLVWRRRAAQ